MVSTRGDGALYREKNCVAAVHECHHVWSAVALARVMRFATIVSGGCSRGSPGRSRSARPTGRRCGISRVRSRPEGIGDAGLDSANLRQPGSSCAAGARCTSRRSRRPSVPSHRRRGRLVRVDRPSNSRRNSSSRRPAGRGEADRAVQKSAPVHVVQLCILSSCSSCRSGAWRRRRRGERTSRWLRVRQRERGLAVLLPLRHGACRTPRWPANARTLMRSACRSTRACGHSTPNRRHAHLPGRISSPHSPGAMRREFTRVATSVRFDPPA